MCLEKCNCNDCHQLGIASDLRRAREAVEGPSVGQKESVAKMPQPVFAIRVSPLSKAPTNELLNYDELARSLSHKGVRLQKAFRMYAHRTNFCGALDHSPRSGAEASQGGGSAPVHESAPPTRVPKKRRKRQSWAVEDEFAHPDEHKEETVEEEEEHRNGHYNLRRRRKRIPYTNPAEVDSGEEDDGRGKKKRRKVDEGEEEYEEAESDPEKNAQNV